MKESNKKRGLKPIDVYIKEVYELAEKMEKMEIIKMPTKKSSTKKNKSKTK